MVSDCQMKVSKLMLDRTMTWSCCLRSSSQPPGGPNFRLCSISVMNMMEGNGRTPHSHEKRPLENPRPSDVQKKPTDNNPDNPVFVNHAAISWHESRKKWIGNVSRRQARTSKDPIISWSTTYEDFLLTNEPFSRPIPLFEMVDFLVDIWHDEGLFD